MRQATIIVPASVIDHAVAAATAQFGGATFYPCKGTWFDGKAIIADDNYKLAIAGEATSANLDKLQAIANSVGMLAKQQCVYVQDFAGEVTLVATAHLWQSANVA